MSKARPFFRRSRIAACNFFRIRYDYWAFMGTEKWYRAHFAPGTPPITTGVIVFPQGTPLRPPNGTPIPEVSLVTAQVEDGPLGDYMPTNIGGRVCSERLHQIVCGELKQRDAIQWLPVSVRDERGETHLFQALHFDQPNDEVLDRERTQSLAGAVIRPYFKRAALSGRSVFGLTGTPALEMFVSASLKAKMEGAQVTGICFMPIADLALK
ncbi:MAG: hypothetical protein NTV51_13110 [Verrucomicrobia bacterium]|nr:hypothetical protein [Verrucomicrobiota bacterium]